jgi:hypothetical protein
LGRYNRFPGSLLRSLHAHPKETCQYDRGRMWMVIPGRAITCVVAPSRAACSLGPHAALLRPPAPHLSLDQQAASLT